MTRHGRKHGIYGAHISGLRQNIGHHCNNMKLNHRRLVRATARRGRPICLPAVGAAAAAVLEGKAAQGAGPGMRARPQAGGLGFLQCCSAASGMLGDIWPWPSSE